MSSDRHSAILAAPGQGSVNPGWLRNPVFDGLFIYGIMSLALLAGAIVVNRPDLFMLILVLDLWLLGYHHVVSTFTRIAFDKHSIQQHRFLLFYLPPMVLAAVALLGFTLGAGAIATVYLHWQFYHYTRQSEGISKAYLRKSGRAEIGHPALNRIAFYLVPLAAFLTMSAASPGIFLGMSIVTVPVPPVLLAVTQLLAVGAFLTWLLPQIRAMIRGEGSRPYFAFVQSHFIIFVTAYALIPNIDYGWLVINIWHNLQYIAFVWLFNTNRYKGGIDPSQRLISTLSQPGNFLPYFIVCFAISTGLYVASSTVVDALDPMTVLPLAVIVFQSVNFHHYIVDSKIWKLRKPMVRAHLNLN